MKLITETMQEAILSLSDASIEPSIKRVLIKHCETLKATEKYLLCDAFITGYHNGSMNEMHIMLDRPITKETNPQKWYADKYENDKNGNK